MALMRTEPWYTLADVEDQQARLYELKVWQFVKLMGMLEEEECGLDTGLSFGGLGDSIRTLHRRLQRLTDHLQCGKDSLTLLEDLYVDSAAEEEPWRPVLEELSTLLHTSPFARLKVGARLPHLRAKLLPELDPSLACMPQAAALLDLSEALRQLLDPTPGEEWQEAQGSDGAEQRQELARQRGAAVQLMNSCGAQLIRVFTRGQKGPGLHAQG